MELQHKPQPGDEKLRVKFYTYQEYMGFKSEAAGYAIFEGVPHISILVPGDVGNEVCRRATKEDKERFLPLWEQYEANQDQTAQGTSLDAWSFLTETHKHQLRYLGFTSVEQLAGASDHQLQKVGMGAHEMRSKAKVFLEAQKDVEAAQRYAEQAEETKRELDKIRAEMAEIKQGTAQTEGQEAARRGRPPKVADVAHAA